VLGLNGPESVAWTKAYLDSGADRGALVQRLALLACRMGNDPHNQEIAQNLLEDSRRNQAGTRSPAARLRAPHRRALASTATRSMLVPFSGRHGPLGSAVKSRRHREERSDEGNPRAPDNAARTVNHEVSKTQRHCERGRAPVTPLGAFVVAPHAASPRGAASGLLRCARQ